MSIKVENMKWGTKSRLAADTGLHNTTIKEAIENPRQVRVETVVLVAGVLGVDIGMWIHTQPAVRGAIVDNFYASKKIND